MHNNLLLSYIKKINIENSLTNRYLIPQVISVTNSIQESISKKKSVTQQ